MSYPNLKNDKLILSKEINLTFNQPAFNFITCQIEPKSKLHYMARMYETHSGKKYYVFESYEDCTLFIMNCNKGVYDKLEKLIELNDEIEIFDGTNGDLCSIPESYRNELGIGGSASIMF